MGIRIMRSRLGTWGTAGRGVAALALATMAVAGVGLVAGCSSHADSGGSSSNGAAAGSAKAPDAGGWAQAGAGASSAVAAVAQARVPRRTSRTRAI